PSVLQRLIDQGALGQKSGAGFYKKDGRDILRFDAVSGDYRPADSKVDPDVLSLLAEHDPAKRLKGLRESPNPQAQFVWAVLRDTFHYSAVHLQDIAETARDLDLAMKWGFGHQQGPFELWQSAEWETITNWIQDDIKQGKTLSST